MLNTLKNRFEQGYRTSRYPKETIELWKRYRGRPQINPKASDAFNWFVLHPDLDSGIKHINDKK